MSEPIQPMTEVQFLTKIRQAYIDAALPAYPGEGIFRHRLRSTSAVQEDIVAYYIRSQHELLQVHVDQPISFELPQGPRVPPAESAETANGAARRKRVLTRKISYPDIVVVRRHEGAQSDGTVGTIIAILDVKTDLGWRRSDKTFEETCNSLLSIRAGLWEKRHLLTRGPNASPYPASAAKFDVARVRCSDSMTCHVVVVTASNSGNIAAEGNARKAIATASGVHLHVLMKLHPNAVVTARADQPPAMEDSLEALNDLAARSLRPADFKALRDTILGTRL